MIINLDQLLGKFGKELDRLVLKNELIASNVANVDTPGFKSKDVTFTREFDDQMEALKMKSTNSKHMLPTTGQTELGRISQNEEPGRPDGNNVNIDDEMLKLTQNNINYNIVIMFLKRKLDGLKETIKEAAK